MCKMERFNPTESNIVADFQRVTKPRAQTILITFVRSNIMSAIYRLGVTLAFRPWLRLVDL